MNALKTVFGKDCQNAKNIDTRSLRLVLRKVCHKSFVKPYNDQSFIIYTIDTMAPQHFLME